jgi:hypothetical protein
MERHRNFSQEILKQLASNDCFLKANRIVFCGVNAILDEPV